MQSKTDEAKIPGPTQEPKASPFKENPPKVKKTKNKDMIPHYQSDCNLMFAMKSMVNGVGKLCN
jgi:hypothetical protein